LPQRATRAAERAAYWTGWLVFVGIVVGILQLWLLIGSLSASQRAAKAAEESNTQLQRAQIAVYIETGTNAEDFFRTKPPLDRPFPWVVKYSVTNYGKSIGWIVGGHYGLTGYTGDDPGQRPEIGEQKLLMRMPLPPDGKRPHEQATDPFPIPPAFIERIWSGEMGVVFHGAVDYEDVFGNSFTHHFAWQWKIVTPGKGGYWMSASPAEWTGEVRKPGPGRGLSRTAERWLRRVADWLHAN
jgi:hypothetical protein